MARDLQAEKLESLLRREAARMQRDHVREGGRAATFRYQPSRPLRDALLALRRGDREGVEMAIYAIRENRPRRNSGVRAVPAHIRRTPRRAASAVSAIGVPGRWPIGDLYHARLALVYALAPAHAKVRARVIAAVKRAHPQYDWDAWLRDKTRRSTRSNPFRSYRGVRYYSTAGVHRVALPGKGQRTFGAGDGGLAGLRAYIDRALDGPQIRRNGPTLQEPYYPFARKEAQYRDYKDRDLTWALRDAIKARDTSAGSARQAERQYGHDSRGAGVARQAENWYADDVHTILAEMRRRGMR